MQKPCSSELLHPALPLCGILSGGSGAWFTTLSTSYPCTVPRLPQSHWLSPSLCISCLLSWSHRPCAHPEIRCLWKHKPGNATLWTHLPILLALSPLLLTCFSSASSRTPVLSQMHHLVVECLASMCEHQGLIFTMPKKKTKNQKNPKTKTFSPFIPTFISHTSSYQSSPVLSFLFTLDHHIKYYLSNNLNMLLILAYISPIYQNCNVGFL